MKLIVIDLDQIERLEEKKKYFSRSVKVKDHYKAFIFKSFIRQINELKICTLTVKDFGKKTLLGLPKNDPVCLDAHRDYEDAIFRLKDDDDQLVHENKMFRKLLKEKKIKWARVGMILRRAKALKICQRLLGIA